MRNLRSFRLVAATLLLCVSALARAQQSAADPPHEKRPTGLPPKVTWTFNLDAGWGSFGFGNSLYTNSRPDPSGDLSDNWFEGFVKPALSATYKLSNGEVYAKLSAAGERTYGAAPSLVGEDASSFKPDDLYIGWRSGKSLGHSENLLDFTVGRAPYKIGRGFLVWDGGGEGGSRGGFWSNARKAWEFAAVGRLKPKHHTIEAFYVDRDEVPESDTQSALTGVNYDLNAWQHTTIGATWVRAFAKDTILPARDGMNVYDARAYTAPLRRLPDLSFELEYAYEKNGDIMHSTGWSVLGAYELSKMGWKPKISYRYASFEGDDPSTSENEAFDSLFPGFYDWGTWWQGEIGGEYFLANSNNDSHQVRVHLSPMDALGWGVIGYIFRTPEPATFGPGATSKDVAGEVDAYADWKINGNFTLSAVGAFANPQDAIEQAYGRTENFSYGMLYLAYAY